MSAWTERTIGFSRQASGGAARASSCPPAPRSLRQWPASLVMVPRPLSQWMPSLAEGTSSPPPRRQLKCFSASAAAPSRHAVPTAWAPGARAHLSRLASRRWRASDAACSHGKPVPLAADSAAPSGRPWLGMRIDAPSLPQGPRASRIGEGMLPPAFLGGRRRVRDHALLAVTGMMQGVGPDFMNPPFWSHPPRW